MRTRLRFDRLFGFARPWSADDYFLWENLIAPKTRLEFQPSDKLRVDMGYGVFWLASDTDSWANARRRDPTGQSGDFIGHERDIRLRAPVTRRLDVTLGYAYFIPGAFTRNTGWSTTATSSTWRGLEQELRDRLVLFLDKASCLVIASTRRCSTTVWTGARATSRRLYSQRLPPDR